GPEPPSNLVFSEVTDSSLKVSWTRPKSPVSGFKVTYTHVEDGEPISVAVDGSDSTLPLSKLSPGSSYEVSVISLLGLDESDPIDGDLPDPPTDLRAINVTDTKALLLWRPALATVDQYVIVYGSEEGEKTLLSCSVIGSGGRGEGPRDLTASQVTPRTAVLSWKPPCVHYCVSYTLLLLPQQEVIIEPGITEYKLTGLHPSSTYTARLQGQRGGVYTTAISTQFTTGTLRFPFPSDCSQELMNGIRESGVVEIFPRGKEGKPVRVYCDMETDGGGWTVFQRRKDGKTNFFRGWQEYSKGFGELEGEFWLGNELLHNLTMMTPMSMRVDLRSGSESVYAAYSTFSVDTMKRHYTLRVSGYSGTAGDSMTYHDRRKFSTRDRDPQPFITRCAMSYKGGWWYKNCHEANLNGLYNTHTDHQGVIWTAWKGKDFSIPFAEMKLRPSSFNPRTQG
uniref:Tenascin XB n=1 Tax=Astyanax mexicanus TaxID=7994 RepID=A0A3B1KJ47_ASTMX